MLLFGCYAYCRLSNQSRSTDALRKCAVKKDIVDHVGDDSLRKTMDSCKTIASKIAYLQLVDDVVKYHSYSVSFSNAMQLSSEFIARQRIE